MRIEAKSQPEQKNLVDLIDTERERQLRGMRGNNK